MDEEQAVAVPLPHRLARLESARGQQFLGAFCCGIQKRFSGNNQQLVILGRLASYQTVDCEQTSDFFHRHAAVRLGLNAKTHRARGTFAQNKTLREKRQLGNLCFSGLLSSAYQRKPLSFQSVPGEGTKLG